MTREDGRRNEDSGLGRLVYLWPVICGVALALTSLGGYITTIHIMGSHLDKIDQLIEGIQHDGVETTKVWSRMIALQETMDKRVSNIEDWRNGVGGIYIAPGRKRGR